MLVRDTGIESVTAALSGEGASLICYFGTLAVTWTPADSPCEGWLPAHQVDAGDDRGIVGVESLSP
jgi:hypothetical protein